MSTVIKLKRGTSTPTTSDIVDGEVAIDTSAQRLFARSGSNILQIGRDTFGANEAVSFGDAGENISGDGTDLTIASSNDLTIDVAGQINFDGSDIGRVHFKHDGTTYGEILRSSQNFQLKSTISNGDLTFHGNDGGVAIEALKLDMSEAGAATFNAGITATTGTFSGDLTVDTNTLHVDSSNNRVGIKDTSPSQALDVAGRTRSVRFVSSTGGAAADAAFYLNDTNGLGIYSPATNEFAISTSASERLRIDSSGDVTVSNDLTISGNLTVSGTTTTVNSTTVNIQNAFVFEGSTADSFETTLTTVDPTADRTISLPNVSGTVITTGNLSDITSIPSLSSLTVTGNTTLGDATSDTVTFNGRISSNFVPSANDTYSLGTSSLKWSELHVAGSTIFLGDAEISADSTKVVLPLNSEVKTEVANTTVRLAQADSGGVPIRSVPLFTKSGGLSAAAKVFNFTAQTSNRINYNGTFTLESGTTTAVNTEITLFQF